MLLEVIEKKLLASYLMHLEIKLHVKAIVVAACKHVEDYGSSYSD